MRIIFLGRHLFKNRYLPVQIFFIRQLKQAPAPRLGPVPRRAENQRGGPAKALGRPH